MTPLRTDSAHRRSPLPVRSTLAACASGESILNAGNDATTTTTPPTTTDGAGVGRAADDDLPRPAVAATTARRRRRSTRRRSHERADPTDLGAARRTVEARPAPPDSARARSTPSTAPTGRCTSRSGTRCSRAPSRTPSSPSPTSTTPARTGSSSSCRTRTATSEVIDKYFQSSQDDRPDIVQMPEYMVQQMADTNSVIPIGGVHPGRAASTSRRSCHGRCSPTRPAACSGRCRSTSRDPVLYYNRDDVRGRPASTRTTRRSRSRSCGTYSQQIVDSGAATYGIALDSGVDSGGGWFLEQWFARAGVPYADNGNGRPARRRRCCFDRPEAVELMTFVQ